MLEHACSAPTAVLQPAALPEIQRNIYAAAAAVCVCVARPWWAAQHSRDGMLEHTCDTPTTIPQLGAL
jgi:hypothetical protein